MQTSSSGNGPSGKVVKAALEYCEAARIVPRTPEAIESAVREIAGGVEKDQTDIRNAFIELSKAGPS